VRRAFTIIELLIVVAIIGLLVALLVPAMGRARAQAKSAVCTANLRQISTGFQEYLARARDRLPFISFMPSVSPAPLRGERAIFLADVLKTHVGEAEAFRCPDDHSGNLRAPPNEGKSYFESERSSYRYRDEFFMLLGGRRIDEVANMLQQRFDRAVSTNTIWVMADYNVFHKKAGTKRVKNYLYIDGHVADYEDF
jgi:prepilin-type N-terminal cleavage/methylation domain-containing protein/prepilin-type processing-associated H-X9-DG protein